MNLGQIKKKAIQIIREYSNNGTIISDSENADYLLSMNGFINDAQFELISVRPIVKKISLDWPIETTSNLKRYAMPLDFSGFKELKNDDYQFTNFDWEGKIMIIPNYYDGDFTLWYFSYPSMIDESTLDSKELEIDLDMQMIIPYYVAGHVLINENKELADYFLAEYANKKNKTNTVSNITIKNVFGW